LHSETEFDSNSEEERQFGHIRRLKKHKFT